MMDITPIPAFRDNYIWMLHGQDGEIAAVVDPGDARPVIDVLAKSDIRLIAILLTHHHADHTGGVREWVSEFNVPVYGPSREATALVDYPGEEGDQFEVRQLGLHFDVFDIPGHTAGHIALYGYNSLFCGDTLFSAGCGRLFEGTAEQMYASLQKLAALPDDTKVYCGHEYTQANLQFASMVEPNNRAVQARVKQVTELRANGEPTLPSTLNLEKQVNPFLRCHVDDVRMAAEKWSGKALDDTVRVFAEVRRWKDDF